MRAVVAECGCEAGGRCRLLTSFSDREVCGREVVWCAFHCVGVLRVVLCLSSTCRACVLSEVDSCVNLLIYFHQEVLKQPEKFFS